MDRFFLEKSANNENYWVLSDTINNIVIRFEQGLFNETQKVSLLNDNVVTEHTPIDLARIMREMGDYIVKYHGDIAFKRPYGFKINKQTNRTDFYRNKYPRWTLQVEDNCTKEKLIDSLKKAVEFLRKDV